MVCTCVAEAVLGGAGVPLAELTELESAEGCPSV